MSANQIDLAALGLDREKIIDLVVERIAEQFLAPDLEQDPRHRELVEDRLSKQIKEAIDARVDAIAAEHVVPRVNEIVSDWQLQQTTTWGEKKGEPVTFTEYLVQRAEAWIREPVSFKGVTKSEDSYNWKPAQARLAWMIDEHLQYHIKVAMERALGTVTESLGKSIADTVKAQIDQLRVHIQASVKS